MMFALRRRYTALGSAPLVRCETDVVGESAGLSVAIGNVQGPLEEKLLCDITGLATERVWGHLYVLGVDL